MPTSQFFSYQHKKKNLFYATEQFTQLNKVKMFVRFYRYQKKMRGYQLCVNKIY